MKHRNVNGLTLDGSLPKMCPAVRPFDQDGRTVELSLVQWFLRRRFLCEFPIGSYVKLSSTVSDFFDCNNGVQQGENFFPFLFSIYLNDLEQF